MNPDYAKEIATRALSGRHGDSDRGLLAETIRYAFGELMTMSTTNELDALIGELQASLEGAA